MEIQLNLYPGSALLLRGSHGLVCVDTISISGHHSNPMDTHDMCGHHSNWWTHTHHHTVILSYGGNGGHHTQSAPSTSLPGHL